MEDGRIPYTQNIKVGSLRISELFGDIQEYSSEFYVILEEYLQSFTDSLAGAIPGNIKHLVVCGTEISSVAELTHAEKHGMFLHIAKDGFLNLYSDIKLKTTDRTATDYRLSIEKAEVLLPAMCIFNNLLKLTQAEKIIATEATLSDAILYEMLCPAEFSQLNADFSQNTLLCAQALARKCRAMEAHYKHVESFAVRMFDKLKKLHGLGPRERLLLQVAAILHDCGKFVNIRGHNKYSYEIIMGTDIVGLNQLETELVANLALYHSAATPSLGDENYRRLDLNNRLLVSKLTAILRIAEALDQSHMQKFSDMDVKLTDSEMLISVATDKNIDLELWSFRDKGGLFEEVYGIKAVIKQKKVM
jgi:exopolyphosphatase/guanosine-5'-triphosphate,3'-diphosphate pyrophosphatase